MTRQPDAPRYVVSSGSDADTVLRRLVRDGWAVREGFALPDPAWDVTGTRLVLHGRITDQDTLQLAVLAAARGAGIVAVCDADSAMGRALIDDLSRLGTVQPSRARRRTTDSASAPEATTWRGASGCRVTGHPHGRVGPGGRSGRVGEGRPLRPARSPVRADREDR